MASSGARLSPLRLPSRTAELLFFLNAVVLFLPFLVQGQVLYASTDHLFGHYPNFIFGYRSLRSGSFGLWNPFIFAGVDFTTSMHHHLLHPRNWPLLLVPERYLFHALSAIVFLEVWLIGVLTIRIVRVYVKDSWAALLAATVGQLSGFIWFTVTTLIGTHLLFSTLAAVYLLVTLERRRKAIAFGLLTLSFFDILAMGHVLYVFSFGVAVCAAFALCLRTAQRERRSVVPLVVVVLSAGVAAVAMASYRLWPVIHGILYEQEFIDSIWLPAFLNHGYFALTWLVPDALGIHLSDAMQISKALGVGEVRHTQFHNVLYTGVVAALLVSLSISRRFGTAAQWVAFAYLGVAIVPVYLLQPLSDTFNLLAFPVLHDILPRTFSWFLIVALVALVGGRLANGHELAKPTMVLAAALFAVASTWTMAMWARVLFENRSTLGVPWDRVFPLLRLATLLGIVSSIACAVTARRLTSRGARTRTTYAIIAFVGVAALVALIGIRLDLFTHRWLFGRAFALSVGALLWTTAVGAVARTAPDRPRYGAILCGALAIILLVVPTPAATGQRDVITNFLGAILGVMRFLALACVMVEVIALTDDVQLRRWRIPLLVALTLGDLLFATKLYQHVGAMPFAPFETLYPSREYPGSSQRMQVGSPTQLLNNPTLQSREREIPQWSVGGRSATADGSVGVVTIQNNTSDTATLFQDVPTTIGQLTFGAWVMAQPSNSVRLLVTSGTHAEHSDYHPADAQWHWLSVKLNKPEGSASVRAHIVVEGPGAFRAFAPRMVVGDVVEVPEGPDGQRLSATASVEPLDLRHYRVTLPDAYLKIMGSETLSNLAMVYELPTYAGVDSDVKSNLVKLIETFEARDPRWYHRGGILPQLHHPRLLDLFGVRYEFHRSGETRVRPDALARVSMFNRSVVAQGDAALGILRRDDFDPTTTVVVDSSNTCTANGEATRFVAIAYRSVVHERVEVDLAVEKCAVVLFNDSYSPFWTARLNGRSLPVQRANAYFMAVTVPPRSRGVLTFEFVPAPFLRLVHIAWVTAAVVVVVIISGIFRERHALLIRRTSE